MKLPDRLAQYVVEQDYSTYSSIDQAVWRFIMRVSLDFFAKHSTPIYLEGLKATGIPVDTIPKISDMNKKLSQFGWGAVAVKGFIPPAIFMEFQSMHLLPISCDMRTLDHLNYTPAPDIVHEAAGHAPIIADPKYAKYLRSYAEVAFKAIRNRFDVKLYEAIRYLSDTKEAQGMSESNILEAERRLQEVVEEGKNLEPSEAALMARMNWWTVEYGLVGDVKSPRIYGAGLLSSVGESYDCLLPGVKKIPFSLDCINYAYDITRPQPQLFVARDFDHLIDVLEEFSDQMAFRMGGIEGLRKAVNSTLVNTIILDSGIEITGTLTDFESDGSYLRFVGPAQLSWNGKVLPNQTTREHGHGFSTPVGVYHVKGDLLPQKAVTLKYNTGIEVAGTVIETVEREGKLLIIRFKDCTVRKGAKILFSPDWGVFDCAVGLQVVSVHAGAADLDAFGFRDRDPHISQEIIMKSNEEKAKNPLIPVYAKIREMRDRKRFQVSAGKELFQQAMDKQPTDWLASMEILELVHLQEPGSTLEQSLRSHLKRIQNQVPSLKPTIDRGLSLVS